MALLSKGLLPATFRGVPFAVRDTSTSFSRRLAVHQYPGRDLPYVEDLGRGARRFRFRGYIVAGDRVYLGGPVQLQRLLLIAAAEAKGAGTLTHPTLGVLNVNCEACEVGEDLGAGTYSEVQFSFVESGKKQFPSLLGATDAGIISGATIAKVAIATAAIRVIALVAGGGKRQPVANRWAGKATQLAGDATSLNNLAARLPGSLGRYVSGATRGFTGRLAPFPKSTTIADVISTASERRLAVSDAAAELAAIAATSDAEAIAAATQALVEQLLAACADPADAIRLLAELARFAPAGTDIAAADVVALNALFRRAAVVALAEASAQYQPSSHDDAVRVMTIVAVLLDDEATTAADGGDQDVYARLRALRVAVIEDLRARGATLSPLRVFEQAAPAPAIVLAQRFYADPARADELVTQVDPIHPLFMPRSFTALAA
jgi:prophage DNA circulation protein